MPVVATRLDDETHKKLEIEALKLGIDKAELVRKFIIDGLEGKTVKPIPFKILPNQFENSKCKKCGKQFKVGEPIAWTPNISFCLDCYIQSMGDKTILAKYLKYRELDKALKISKQELNKYLDLINYASALNELPSLFKKINEIILKNEEYYQTFNEETIKNLNQEFQPILERLREISLILNTMAKVKLPKIKFDKGDQFEKET